MGLTFREMFGEVRLRERQPLSISSVSILSRWSELSCCLISCRRLGREEGTGAMPSGPRMQPSLDCKDTEGLWCVCVCVMHVLLQPQTQGTGM